jgi:hypothetical protein
VIFNLIFKTWTGGWASRGGGRRPRDLLFFVLFSAVIVLAIAHPVRPGSMFTVKLCANLLKLKLTKFQKTIFGASWNPKQKPKVGCLQSKLFLESFSRDSESFFQPILADNQCDRMSLSKYRPKWNPTHFLPKLIHNNNNAWYCVKSSRKY